MPLITEDLVLLDLGTTDRASTTRALAERLHAAGRVTDVEAFLSDVAAREAQMPTGLEGGIGIPHARSAAVAEPSLAFARSDDGVDWGAPDGPARLIFLIAAPDGAGGEHMKILAALARRLVHQSFKDSLATAADPAAVVKLITEEVIDR
ncbi:PTS sugar transporter subunit IIA [Actinokineospora xionganensis]|uniref:PTS sugar transporter subunit IIA n=1 Tax=Actinokineospora xionganensis TaxID=2684470 RepID=A0ABR7LA61_9PSEU|nr:fructose PTS transporter subunit IIA [Actinokineospora xionganensis]MBC6449605.1 PTS sugar transporter subunit IIA [Actinokineospora xionganensis]